MGGGGTRSAVMVIVPPMSGPGASALGMNRLLSRWVFTLRTGKPLYRPGVPRCVIRGGFSCRFARHGRQGGAPGTPRKRRRYAIVVPVSDPTTAFTQIQLMTSSAFIMICRDCLPPHD